MAVIPENPPAFPQPWGSSEGMLLRDWFAGQAVEQCIRNAMDNVGGWDFDGVAYHAYRLADAMLAQRTIDGTPTADQSEVDRLKAAGIQNIVNGKCLTCGEPSLECECIPF